MMAGFDLYSVCACCRDKKKGEDPCVEKPGSDCLHYNTLSPEQLVQLSMPSYKIKKEKCELKTSTPSKNPASDNTLSPTLVDPALVSVVGVVGGQSTSGSPGLSEQPAEKKKKKEEEKKASSSKSNKPEKSVKSTSTSHRPASSVSTDQKIVLDKKWSYQFNWLEAPLLAKDIDRPQEPTFTAVKVTPTHAPPASAIRPKPFMKPPEQQSSQQSDRPPISDLPATDSAKPSAATKTGSVPSQS